MRRRMGRQEAPEFPDDLRWVNAECPLRMRDLQGKVVLLSFWSSCCINCMHVVPDLNRLLEAHSPDLVVIGVHSPRFTRERQDEVVCSAVARHEANYPVINDRDMEVWSRYGIEAWPTTVLITPSGEILARRTGEGVFAAFDDKIVQIIRDADRVGGLSHDPVRCVPERPAEDRTGLSFPAGITADETGGHLFISDTGNNRVLIADFGGEVLDVVGTGQSGMQDGPFGAAMFNGPLGLALDGNALYVADRGNHSVRRLDLDDRMVRTVAGTGEQILTVMEPGKAHKTQLNSPWDLTIIHHRLYITMAGAHQIWRMDLMSDDLEPYAGGGHPGLKDGTRLGCSFAQPTGLTTDGVRLFVVDAGSSAVRYIYLPPSAQVGTWIGKGVFEYGDRDGIRREALLQHPQGIAHHLGELFIADTFNNKIKRLNPRSGRIQTMFGTTEAGFEDGLPGALNEPAAIAYADDRLWIADRDNHAIRVGPVHDGSLSTLELYPPERLALTAQKCSGDAAGE